VIEPNFIGSRCTRCSTASDYTEPSLPILKGGFTASIIVPFAASSIMIIISQPPETDEKGHIRQSQHKRLKLFPAGIMAMMVGFVYIIAAVITITLIV
jgi:hypothetical protein